MSGLERFHAMMAAVTRLLLVSIAFMAAAACSDKNDPTMLRPFDAGTTGARDAEEDDDAGTSTAADAAIDLPDALVFPDAEPAETGFPDAEPAETGFPDAERAEVAYIDAEPNDTGDPYDGGEPIDVGLDAGLDAGLIYDATVCTGQIGGTDPCTMCAESSCCSELVACDNSITCSNEFTSCLAPCTLSAPVSQCMMQCFVSAEGVALRTCVTNQCGTVCP